MTGNNNDNATTPGTSRQDEELTGLLAKLYAMQEDLGAKPKSTDQEKRDKAANVATMGKGRKAEKKGTRFLELKSVIVERLQNIHGMLKEVKSKEAAGYGGDNAKELIKLQAEIREQIRQATDEWKEMDGIYKKEARKKKSKFTIEELNAQEEFCKRLASELEKVREAQMRGYAKGTNSQGANAGTAAALNTQALYRDAGNGKMKSSFGGGGGGAALTDGQRLQLQQIEERDAEMDKDLDEIGEGIQDLADIAQMQGEEVKRQSAMLDRVNNKMDQVQQRIQNNNTRLKETLSDVRSGDKLCVDIMCIVLAIGFASVIYNFVSGDTGN